MATLVWRRSRWISAAVLSLAAVFLLFGIDRLTNSALATAGTSSYVVPQVVDTNPDPDIVETTITAESAAVDIGGSVLANVLTFNGTVPGPEFRLKVGDTVIVHYENHLGHNSGIHWHGIELANASDGTPLTQNQVPPFGTFLYKFRVTRPGIYWYHPHHHSSTNQVFKGLYGSIIVTDPNEAALVEAGRIPGPDQTLTMALSDITVCKSFGANDAVNFSPALPWVGGGPLPAQSNSPKSLCETSPIDEEGAPRGPYVAGDVPNIQKTVGTVNEGQTVLTNGKNVGARGGTPFAPGPLAFSAETYPVVAGQGLRLQIGNVATTRFFRLRLTDDNGQFIQLFRIGGQGGLLDEARVEGDVVGPPAPGQFVWRYQRGEILLGPGERADVVAAIPPGADGVLTLWTEDFQRTGTGFANIPTVPVAHFEVNGATRSVFTIAHGTGLRSFTGSPVGTIGPATASFLDPGPFGKPGMAGDDIQLTNPGNVLGINSVKGEHDFEGDYTAAPHPDSTRYAKLGETLELTVTNHTGAHHPFHLHGFSIQPISLSDEMPGPPPAGSPDKSPGTGPTYTFPYREFVDTIEVPGGYTLNFKVRLDDRPMMDGVTPGGGYGRWVFHCHIFFHASFGMISEVDVVNSLGFRRPNINVIERVIFGNPGDPVEVIGTYFDPERLGVRFEASFGIMSDLGDGRWRWAYTPRGGERGQVFFSVIGAGDLRDQIAMSININAAPAVTVTPAAGSEGAAIAIHGTALDPDREPVTTNWTIAPGAGVDRGASCTSANPGALDTTVTCTDDGVYTLTLTASDGRTAASQTSTLTVSNAAPTLAIATPVDNARILGGTPLALALTFADAGTNDTGNCAVNWGDGAITPGVVTLAPGGGACAGTHVYLATAARRTITASVTDDDGGTRSQQVQVVVFTARSLKEDALAQAQALLPGVDRRDRNEVAEVVRRLERSLEPQFWEDGNHLDAKRGERVFQLEEQAAGALVELKRRSRIPIATIQGMLDLLVQADRILAQRALDDAVESRGDPRDIAEGGRAMLRASAAVAAGRFEAAIGHYEDAWLEAQEAMRRHHEGHRRHD